MSKSGTLLLDDSKESFEVDLIMNGNKKNFTTIYVDSNKEFTGPTLITDGVTFKGKDKISRYIELSNKKK